MAQFATDENFNENIVNGVLRSLPDISLVSIMEFGLSAAPDPVILEWSARERYVLITHDYDTMPGFAYERVSAGFPMPGLVLVPSTLSITTAVRDLVLMFGCILDEEWESQVRYIPLR